MSLTTSQIPNLPFSIHYIPNFLPATSHPRILSAIQNCPKPKWTQLAHRRLQTYPTALTSRSILVLPPTTTGGALPTWLVDPIVPLMHDLGIWSSAPHSGPNHVLVNEYLPGQGILPHQDGPAYFPVVATVSLGSAIVLDLYEKREGGKVSRVLQEEGSLLVMTGEMYTSNLHGISEVLVDEDLGPDTVSNWDMLGDKSRFTCGRNERGTRVSLTYRDVVKVARVGSEFLR